MKKNLLVLAGLFLGNYVMAAVPSLLQCATNDNGLSLVAQLTPSEPTIPQKRGLAISGPADDPMTSSYQAGQCESGRALNFCTPGSPGFDPSDPALGGTQTMRLEPSLREGFPRIYAAMSYWKDVPKIGKPDPAPQILVLDSSRGRWRLLREFTRPSPKWKKTPYYYEGVYTIRAVKITYDRTGKVLKKPVFLVVAGVGTLRGQGVLWTYNEESGAWTHATVPNVRSFRAIELFHDPDSGADLIFVGGQQNGHLDSSGHFQSKNGIYVAGYDARSGQLLWSQKPEFITTSLRINSFAEAEKHLYCSAQSFLYKRVTNGSRPQWLPARRVYPQPFPGIAPRGNGGGQNMGLRGLTAVRNPDGQGQVLLGALEGNPAKILRFTPTKSNDEPVFEEYDISHSISPPIPKPGYVLAAYNSMTPVHDPDTGDLVHLIGLDIMNGGSAKFNLHYTGYLIRDGRGEFSFHQVKALPEGIQNLDGIRTMTISPFPEDQGQVLFFGGHDAHNIPVPSGAPTAWIYRIGLRTALKSVAP
jgi:hypothetical protein